MSFSSSALTQVYRRLYEHYGPQHWWPGDSRFEIMVGAVLTQNTAWTNVERAIANIKTANLLDPASIANTDHQELAKLLRPSGYFNVKAKRLRALCEFLLQHPELKQLDDQALRDSFLAVHGIGPETADDILLYAFERPVFVIDAYTRRLFIRLGLLVDNPDYDALRRAFEQALPANVAMFNEYHALIVHHAKQACKPKPDCGNCCLIADCQHPINS